MKTSIFLLALFTFVATTTRSAAQTLPGWGDPVWADEFNGPGIDPNNWTYDIGGGGWGNKELEFYTNRPENARIVPDGAIPGNHLLLIEARKEQYRNRSYTSARLKTQGLQNWTYGRVEARINIPGGGGVWPAFWMLGANFSAVGWPDCGELDILEHVEVPPDMTPNTVRGSAHGPNYSGGNSFHGDATLQSGDFINSGPLTGNFHVFAIEWEPAEIRWYVDGIIYYSLTPATVTAVGPWEFDHPFFIILNLAIGGLWPGTPDPSLPFPVDMYVDYVRVYQKAVPPPPGQTAIHVASLTVVPASNGPNWQAVATVTVRDGAGSPVAGVTVDGGWSGLSSVGVTQTTTDSSGLAVLSSGRVKQQGTITFCVTDLIKTGCFYSHTGQDCGSVTK